MAVATWREMRLSDLASGEGWRYDDAVLLEKLCTSLRRHGQLRALVVRRMADGRMEVVDGRGLLCAMLALGWTEAWVADVGAVEAQAAQQMRLDLELRFETDFAALAYAVAGMVEAGATPESLAAASPFDVQRIGHFVHLADWDWSMYRDGVADGQAALSWDAEEPPQASGEAGHAGVAGALPERALEPASQPGEAPTEEPGLEPEPFVAAMAAAIPPRSLERPMPEAPDPEPAAEEKPRRRKPEPQLALF